MRIHAAAALLFASQLLLPEAIAKTATGLRPKTCVIEMGSNSLRLALTNARGKVTYQGRYTTKLGAQVLPGGLIPLENQTRTFAALKQAVAQADRRGCQVYVVATAAVRKATGTSETALQHDGLTVDGRRTGKNFLAWLKQQLAPTAQFSILDGQREATLTFSGALSDWPAPQLKRILGRAPKQLLFADTGGGSNQLLLGDASGQVMASGSVSIGSHALLEQVFIDQLALDGDGLSARQLSLADRRLARIMPEVAIAVPRSAKGGAMILAGGFAKILAILFGKKAITRAEVEGLRSELSALPAAQRHSVLTRRLSETLSAAPARTRGVQFSRARVLAELKDRQLDQQLSETDANELIAKATLALRVLSLTGFTAASDTVLLTTRDARHGLLEELDR